MTIQPEPERGDLVQIDWVDIFEDSVGNPDRAELAARTSIGFFWARKSDRGVECVVTTTTMDAGDHSVSGYCIYPLSCVVKMRIIKRTRRRTRAKKGAA